MPGGGVLRSPPLSLEALQLTEFPDMVRLARSQFAFVVSFHIIFPSFTIGLASYLAVLE